MSLSNKLRTGLVVMLLLVAVQSWTHFSSTQDAQSVFENGISVHYLAAEELSEMARTAHEMRRYEKEILIYIAGGKREKYAKEWMTAYGSLKEKLNNLRNTPAFRFSQDDLDQMGDWQRALENYGAEFQRIVSGSESANTTITANEAIGPAEDRLKILFTGSEQMMQARRQSSDQAYSSIHAVFEKSDTITLAMALGGFVMGLFMMSTLPRAIVGPLQGFTKVVDEMSRNLVGEKIDDLKIAEEFKPLATSLERLRASQAGLVARLRKKGGAGTAPGQ